MNESKEWFVVKIEHYRQVPKKRREWRQVSDHGNSVDGGATYDYAYYDGEEIETVTAFEQRLGQCDVKAVIKAVNGITEGNSE